jgi:hypothetical protein
MQYCIIIKSTNHHPTGDPMITNKYRIYIHLNGMTEYQIFSTIWEKWVTLHSESYPHLMDTFAASHEIKAEKVYEKK